MRSPKGRHVGFYLNAVLTSKQVKAICRMADWSAEEFEDFHARAIRPEVAPGAIEVEGSKLLQ
jgi:hypothetical protein